LSRFGARLHQELFYLVAPPGFINLSHATPDLHHFPFPVWRRLLARRFRQTTHGLFDYAAQAGGYLPLRREIAAYVARSRAVRCRPEQVIVVNGSQQGLDLCARLLLEAGDTVALENPGYRGAIWTFAAHGARRNAVPVDADGIVVAEISAKARLVYVTPSHQFPTGVSMSLARRLELIEWARQSGAAIIEDDYDSEYRYVGAPLPALQGLAEGVATVYLGTFSKVMFPSLRIGYVIVPEQLVKPFGAAKWLADRQTPLLEQAALADFIREGHLERHVRRMRRLYARRREVMVESLARYFGDRASFSGDAAGMHILVRLDDPEIAERAARNKVILTSSAACYLTGPAPGEFVFAFSALTERTIREAVKRLAA
jgi:GntR family transcriptional regulator/MocR family aminotransferase